MQIRQLQNYGSHFLSRKLGMRYEINARTFRHDILYPACEQDFSPALFLDGQLEKIERIAFGRNLNKEIDQIMGRSRILQPILRIHITEAYLTPKYIFSGKFRKLYSNHVPDRLRQNYRVIDEADLASSYLGTNYFGHWLRDDCATWMLAGQTGARLVMPTPDWPEQADYAARFDQNWTPSLAAYCRKLQIYQDTGQNPNKAERFRQLREALRRHAVRPGAHDLVYLKRGPRASKRSLVNEEEVMQALQAMGAHIHEAESGLAQLESTALDARIIIGVEGSQLSHALYMLGDAGGLLVLQPPQRVFNSHLDWCRQLGMDYALIVGDPEGEGFTVDIEALKRTVDLLDRAGREQRHRHDNRRGAVNRPLCKS